VNLSELCIRRPVFASVLSLVVVLVGLMGYSRLPVREYPNIDEPMVSVTTEYRGASPGIIESQVTQPLEEVLSGIEGVDLIVFQSREGRSRISVRFRIDRDQDSAAADVRDRVSRARRQLPRRSTSR
jgi:multidrug efflux pump